MLNLKIIIGNTRPERAADQVIPWITARSREHGGFGVEVLNPTLPSAVVRLMAAKEGAGK